MADQTRRVGLLKAVGGTPGLVAAVLLAEYVVLALVAAAAGLVVGWLTAPLLTSPGAGLVGSAGRAVARPCRRSVVVIAVALAVAVVATLVPAIRAARTSTVSALADAARPPRRTAPADRALGAAAGPAAARPAASPPAGRAASLLGAASIAITVSGIVAVLAFHATRRPTLRRVRRLTNPVARPG